MGKYLAYVNERDDIPWADLVSEYWNKAVCSSECKESEFEKELLERYPSEYDGTTNRTSFVYDCLLHLIASYQRKRKTLDQRLEELFRGNKRVLSCTFTFRPEVLEQYSEDYLEKKCREYIESKSEYFVLNRDYRPGSGAFHIHAYIRCRYINPNEWKSKGFGFAKVKRAVFHKKKSASYMLKMERHCIKASTGGARVRYSANLRSEVPCRRVGPAFGVYEVRLIDKGNAKEYSRLVQIHNDDRSLQELANDAKLWRDTLYKEWEVRAFSVSLCISPYLEEVPGAFYPSRLLDKDRREAYTKDLETWLGHPIRSKRQEDED